MPNGPSAIKMKDIAVALVIAIFFSADRWLKSLALSWQDRPPRSLISSWLDFGFAANEQIAFSLPLGGAWLNYLLGAIIISLSAYLIRLIKRHSQHRQEIYLLSAVIAGALSNLLDRWRHGYVIDYLDLRYFTIFNLADIMISLGVIGLIYLVFKKSGV